MGIQYSRSLSLQRTKSGILFQHPSQFLSFFFLYLFFNKKLNHFQYWNFFTPGRRCTYPPAPQAAIHKLSTLWFLQPFAHMHQDSFVSVNLICLVHFSSSMTHDRLSSQPLEIDRWNLTMEFVRSWMGVAKKLEPLNNLQRQIV